MLNNIPVFVYLIMCGCARGIWKFKYMIINDSNSLFIDGNYFIKLFHARKFIVSQIKSILRYFNATFQIFVLRSWHDGIALKTQSVPNGSKHAVFFFFIFHIIQLIFIKVTVCIATNLFIFIFHLIIHLYSFTLMLH
jgi:hypothetical protein